MPAKEGPQLRGSFIKLPEDVRSGPNLGLLVNANDGEAHGAELRHFLCGVDALVQARVKGKDLATPSASPADGDCYLVAGAATGA